VLEDATRRRAQDAKNLSKHNRMRVVRTPGVPLVCCNAWKSDVMYLKQQHGEGGGGHKETSLEALS
jgi:hypothetical protein